MKELSAKLLRLIETTEPRLREMSELESTKPISPGGWSRKEVIGHLIDSASNNHQRFVRAALQTSLDFLVTTKTETYGRKLFKKLIGSCWSRCGPLIIATSFT